MAEIAKEEPQEPQQNETIEDKQESEPQYIEDPILGTDEMKKLFVGGISPDSKDEDLKTFFEEISGGEVTEHVVIRKEDKKSIFAFVTFGTSELADDVLLKRADLIFDGRTLEINRAVPKTNNSPGAHEKTKKLFIANLPKFDCTEQDLESYFKQRHPEKYGTIESIQLIKKKDDKGNKIENENKGFGFILVSSEDMADRMSIQHASFEFAGRKIELKKSVPTSEGGGGGRGQKSRGGGQNNYGGGGGGGGYDYYGGGYGYDPYFQGAYGGGYGGFEGYGGYSNYGPSAGGRGARRGGGRGGRYNPY